MEILAALTYTQDFVVGAHHAGAWLGHTWSLAVEEQFYLAWPVALAAMLASRVDLRRRLVGLAIALGVLAALSAAVLDGQAVMYTPLGCTSQLVVGAALAVIPFRVPRLTWIVAVAAVAVVWIIAPDPRSRELHYGPMQLFTVGSVLLIAWAMTYTPRVLTAPPVVWIGRRSYGIYLYHLPLLSYTLHVTGRRSVGAAVGIAASFAVAASSYRLIEAPFLKRKRKHAQIRPG